MFFQDLRYSTREIRKSPGFALTTILTISFAIGATTAIFSVVEGVLLRPLPFREPGKLITIHEDIPSLGGDWALVPAPNVVAYSRDSNVFTAAGGSLADQAELSGVGEPEQIYLARITASAFDALGVTPVLGRVFTRDENTHGQTVAVLSDAMWRSRFQGDHKVIGRQIVLNRQPYTVIGVMPDDFEYPIMPGRLNRIQLWVPLTFTNDDLTRLAGSPRYTVIARLKPGVPLGAAEAEVNRVGRDIVANRPSFMQSVGPMTVHLHALDQETVSQARPMLQVLFLAVTVLLLVACANVAGLLLVRAIRRQREVAVRIALGARASEILSQCILESALLWAPAGLLGILFAAGSLRAVVRFLPEALPRLSAIALDWRVVAFALAVTAFLGFLCGLVPAFASLRTDLRGALRESGRADTASSSHVRLRSTLVTAEVATALILLTAAGLLFRSFERMREVDPGFSPEHTVVAGYSLPPEQYSTQARVSGFNEQLLRRLRQIPGTQDAGLTTTLPLRENFNAGFIVEGYVTPQGGSVVVASWCPVFGDYFRALQVPLIRGRYFTESDNATAPLAAIVSRSFAEQYWPGQDPIGKHLRLGSPEMKIPWMTVVGEVADVKEGSPDTPNTAQFYESVDQVEAAMGDQARSGDVVGGKMNIALRTALPPETVENAVRQTVRSLDPQLAITGLGTMEQAINDSEAPRRFSTLLLVWFAIAAVLLGVLGIYSVIAFSVVQRQHEIAIRIALGAEPGSILRLVLASGIRVAAVGCGAGLLGSLAASPLLKSLLFQVTPFDPSVLLFSVGVVLFLALSASFLPALRAASLDPMQTLRNG